MARTVKIGPLRVHAAHHSGGDVLVALTPDGRRSEFPRSTRVWDEASALVWEAYRTRNTLVGARAVAEIFAWRG